MSRYWYVEAVQFLSVPGTTVIFVGVSRHSLSFLIVCSYMVAVYFLCAHRELRNLNSDKAFYIIGTENFLSWNLCKPKPWSANKVTAVLSQLFP